MTSPPRPAPCPCTRWRRIVGAAGDLAEWWLARNLLVEKLPRWLIWQRGRPGAPEGDTAPLAGSIGRLEHDDDLLKLRNRLDYGAARQPSRDRTGPPGRKPPQTVWRAPALPGQADDLQQEQRTLTCRHARIFAARSAAAACRR